MINSILTGLVAGFIAGFVATAVVFGVFYVAKRRILRAVREFVSPDSQGGASAFALLCSSIAGVFGAEISAHLKATFLGLQSVDAKNERRQVADSVISGNGILSAIVGSFPAVGRKMRNNPAMAGLASILVDKFASSNQSSRSSSPAKQNGFDNF